MKQLPLLLCFSIGPFVALFFNLKKDTDKKKNPCETVIFVKSEYEGYYRNSLYIYYNRFSITGKDIVVNSYTDRISADSYSITKNQDTIYWSQRNDKCYNFILPNGKPKKIKIRGIAYINEWKDQLLNLPDDSKNLKPPVPPAPPSPSQILAEADTVIVERFNNRYFIHAKQYVLEDLTQYTDRSTINSFIYSNPNMRQLRETVSLYDEYKAVYYTTSKFSPNVVFLYPDGKPVDITIVTNPDEVQKLTERFERDVQESNAKPSYPILRESSSDETNHSNDNTNKSNETTPFSLSNCTVSAKGKTFSLSGRVFVHITDNYDLADIKVYLTGSWGIADLRVDASGNSDCGYFIWTTSSNAADIRVYITNNLGVADLKVYYTK